LPSRTVLTYFLSVLQNRLCDISLACCCLCSGVIQLVLQIRLIFGNRYLCEQLFSLMKRKKIFRTSGRADVNNESSKNSNINSEINKLSTDKRCNFLENIVPINETSEHKQNGYCNVEFVFIFGSNKCFLYFLHYGIHYH
jgi:hypothetical protein